MSVKSWIEWDMHRQKSTSLGLFIQNACIFRSISRALWIFLRKHERITCEWTVRAFLHFSTVSLSPLFAAATHGYWYAIIIRPILVFCNVHLNVVVSQFIIRCVRNRNRAAKYTKCKNNYLKCAFQPTKMNYKHNKSV